MAFQTIGFIGLGLIGGSIVKKMKSNQPDIKIYATAHHKETIQEAYREGLIENNDLLPLSAFSDCDYIFLCAPVQRNLAYRRSDICQIGNNRLFRLFGVFLPHLSHRIGYTIVEPIGLQAYQQERGKDGEQPDLFDSSIHIIFFFDAKVRRFHYI